MAPCDVIHHNVSFTTVVGCAPLVNGFTRAPVTHPVAVLTVNYCFFFSNHFCFVFNCSNNRTLVNRLMAAKQKTKNFCLLLQIFLQREWWWWWRLQQQPTTTRGPLTTAFHTHTHTHRYTFPLRPTTTQEREREREDLCITSFLKKYHHIKKEEDLGLFLTVPLFRLQTFTARYSRQWIKKERKKRESSSTLSEQQRLHQLVQTALHRLTQRSVVIGYYITHFSTTTTTKVKEKEEKMEIIKKKATWGMLIPIALQWRHWRK